MQCRTFRLIGQSHFSCVSWTVSKMCLKWLHSAFYGAIKAPWGISRNGYLIPWILQLVWTHIANETKRQLFRRALFQIFAFSWMKYPNFENKYQSVFPGVQLRIKHYWLVQAMVWYGRGDKPSCGPMNLRFLNHQWVPGLNCSKIRCYTHYIIQLI